MENKLKALFDYQKFQNNKKLASLIEETQGRYGAELSDQDLELVSAAGMTIANADPGTSLLN